MPPGKLADFGIGHSRLQAWEAPAITTPPKLFATRLAMTAHTDDAIVPRNYYGTHGMKCAACHEKAGEPVGYALSAIPGSDQNLSWFPWKLRTLNTDAMPELDYRWPVRLVKR